MGDSPGRFNGRFSYDNKTTQRRQPSCLNQHDRTSPERRIRNHQPSSNGGGVNEGWQRVVSRRTKQLEKLQSTQRMRSYRIKHLEAQHAKALREKRCFRCLAKGHIRAYCREPPRCYMCHKYGHLSARCNDTINPQTKPQNKAQTPPSHQQAKHTKPPTINTPHHKSYADTLKEPLHMAEEFWSERPEEEDIYLKPKSPPGKSNQLLGSSAWITILTGEHTPGLPLAIKRMLAYQFGAYPEYFKVHKTDRGRYLLVCTNTALRNKIVDCGPYDIAECQVRINLTRWEETSGMSFQPPGYEAWVQLIGAPLQLWNEEELQKLAVKVGTIKYVMPYGLQTGQLEKMTLLIASKHPRRIPKFLKVHLSDYAKRIRVKLLGWRIAGPGYFPPPQPPNGTQPLSHYSPQPRYNCPNLGDQYYPPSPEYEVGESSAASNMPRKGPTNAQETNNGQTIVKGKKVIWVVQKGKIKNPMSINTNNINERNMKLVILKRTDAIKPAMTAKKISTVNPHQTPLEKTKQRLNCNTQQATRKAMVTRGSGVTQAIHLQVGNKILVTVTRQQEFTSSMSLININWSALASFFYASQTTDLGCDRGAVGFKKYLGQSVQQLETYVGVIPTNLGQSIVQYGPTELIKPGPRVLKYFTCKLGCLQSGPLLDVPTELQPWAPQSGLEDQLSESTQEIQCTHEIKRAKKKGLTKTIINHGPLRQSLRLQTKNTGPYQSTMQRACKLKGERSSETKSKNRKPKHNKPTPTYLQATDPLTTYQAEVVVNMAGIEVSEEIKKTIANLVLREEIAQITGEAQPRE